MWSLAIVLIAFFTGSSYANGLPGQVFTEIDRYPTEDEIVEALIADSRYSRLADGDSSGLAGSEYGGDITEERFAANQDSEDVAKVGKQMAKEQKEAPVRKREGQEEFATFVDPAPSKRLASEKQVFHGEMVEKRARVDGSKKTDGDIGDTVFIAVTTVCTAAAVFGLLGAAFVWRRVHNRHRAARESEYPHYGVTGPAKERSGSTSPVAVMDAKLASSAQLYHYQHTKQQIIAMEQSTCESKGRDSDDSEGEEDEGDFSVYEYPGLAPTGDIEVTNPLFDNASPKTKTDPKLGTLEPGVHQRRSEDQ